MRFLIAILLLTALLAYPAPAPAHDSCARAECARVKQQIREIESKMRAGYTRAQGERYNAKLRKLREKRAKLCR